MDRYATLGVQSQEIRSVPSRGSGWIDAQRAESGESGQYHLAVADGSMRNHSVCSFSIHLREKQP
jgi:hypothetical protein